MALDFDAEILELERVSDEWMNSNGTRSLDTVLRRALKRIKTTPEMRLAIYLKLSYGGLYHGEEKADWIHSAKEISKILGGK